MTTIEFLQKEREAAMDEHTSIEKNFGSIVRSLFDSGMPYSKAVDAAGSMMRSAWERAFTIGLLIEKARKEEEASK